MNPFIRLIPLLFLAQTVFGQSYSFLSYSTSEGLPQSQVTCITQDESGYLWVGTLSGLAKFNGKKFISFSTENGLVNNRITALSILDNKLWVGHEGGVSVMVNGKAKGWQLFGEDRTVAVTDIVHFNKSIVVATNGGGLYFINGEKIHKSMLPNTDANRCRDLMIRNGVLYIATRSGAYSTSDLKQFNLVKSFGNFNISSFAEGKDEVFVSTFFTGQLFRADNRVNLLDSISLIPIPDADFFNPVRSYVDSKGQIWLNSYMGVIRINNEGEQLLLNEANGLPIDRVDCIFEDREGIIWMGTGGKGLLRFTGEQFVYYNTRNGFPSDLILSVARSPQGNYLYGSYDNGLFTWNKRDGMKEIKVQGTSIWALEHDAYGNLWCGSDKGITVLFRDGSEKRLSIDDKNGRITVIRKFPNGMLIAGGSDGMAWIRGENLVPIRLKTDFTTTIGIVRDFAWFNQRIICAGDKGLFEITPKTGDCKRLKDFSFGVTSLSVDDNNRLWVGTENGLFLFDGLKFESLNTGSSSGSRFINFQQKIRQYIYIGTNNGMYVFDSKEEKPYIVKHYGINNGLINLESNINSAFYDGRFLWFGTAEGMIRFDVRKDGKFRPSGIRPLLTINDILLNYQPFDYSLYSERLNEDGLPVNLRLPYNKNNISIDLDGILLSNPNGLRYQFWLEGQDEGWSPMLSNPSIVLSNIRSGDYTLHIRTVDEMGVLSKEILLPIHITPPFWGTWWFYLLIFILIVLGIRSFFRSRIRKERERNYKENLENKTRLLALEQQSLNASMNRHFIFNSLNSIQYFINTQDKISANRYLTNFAKLIRKNLDSAVELDNMVTLQQEMERLELYLSLEAMRFKDRFTYHINDNGIDLESIIVPGMLLQPFVENSIIHGILPNEQRKGHIEVTVRIQDEHLEITIDDNGIGIDFSLQQKHAINGDHKSQGMEITAKRIDIIRELSKKDFELEGPFQVTNPDQSIKGTRVSLKIPVENLDISD